MSKIILSFDSQNLNGIQGCYTKSDYQFLENLTPQTKAPALEKGDLLHKIMEIADGLLGSCVDIEADTWLTLAEAQLFNPDGLTPLLNSTRENKVNYALEAGRYFASKMEIEADVSSSVIYQCKEYYEFYRNDPWSTLFVEQVATKVLYEDDSIKILYTGKIDRGVEQGNIKAPMDHKSSERRQDPSSLSNQFIGYCWLLGMNHIIIDKIGFQKTLKPAERFQRYILTIDDQRKKEWELNSIASILSYQSFQVEDEELSLKLFKRARELKQQIGQLMNLTHCDKYGSCIYATICEANPEGRSWKKERDFIVGPTWDVAKVLEG